MDWGKVFQAANARGMKLYFSTLVRENGWVRCFSRVHMSRLTCWRGKKNTTVQARSQDFSRGGCGLGSEDTNL